MSTVTHPLSGLIDGMIKGYALAHQIKAQAMQQEAFERAKVDQDHERSVNAIKDRMMMEDAGATPVQNGRISRSFDATVPDATGLGLPPVSNTVTYDGPPDHSRTVAIRGFNGQDQEYQMPTGDERMLRQVQRAASMKHATMTPIQTPAHLRELGLPSTIWVPDDHLTQYAEATSQTQPIDTPQGLVDAGYPSKMTRKNLPQVVSGMNTQVRTGTQRDIAAGHDATRLDVAEQNNETRTDIADNNRDAANTRADNRNATTIQATGIRSTPKPPRPATLTPNGQTAEERDIANKENGTAATPGLHAQREQIGVKLGKDYLDTNGKPLTDGARKLLRAQYASLTDSLQALQLRKAKLYRIQAPPPEVMGQIPEGQTATSPDGHTWKKQDGVVYFVN